MRASGSFISVFLVFFRDFLTVLFYSLEMLRSENGIKKEARQIYVHLTLFCALGVCNTRAQASCVGITKTAVKYYSDYPYVA